MFKNIVCMILFLYASAKADFTIIYPEIFQTADRISIRYAPQGHTITIKNENLPAFKKLLASSYKETVKSGIPDAGNGVPVFYFFIEKKRNDKFYALCSIGAASNHMVHGIDSFVAIVDFLINKESPEHVKWLEEIKNVALKAKNAK